MATLQVWAAEVLNRSTDDKVVDVINLSTASRLMTMSTATSSQIVQDGGGDWVGSARKYVQLYADGPLHLAAGVSPVASSGSGIFLPSETLMTVTVEPGHKIAVADA